MIIDYVENIILIKEQSLKSNHISQLHAWDFKRDNDGTFRNSSKDNEKILFKVIKYFQKQSMRKDFRHITTNAHQRTFKNYAKRTTCMLLFLNHTIMSLILVSSYHFI